MHYIVYLNEKEFFKLSFIDGRFFVDDFGSGYKDLINVNERDGIAVVSFFRTEVAEVGLNEYFIKYYDKNITSSEIRTITQLFKKRVKGEPVDNELISYSILSTNNDRLKEDVSSTELHTHFIEMLSGEDFISVLLDNFVDYIPVNEAGNLIGYLGTDENGRRLSIMDYIDKCVVRGNDEKLFQLAKQLEIPVDGQYSFEDLSDRIAKRNNLIDFAIHEMKRKFPEQDINFRSRVCAALLIKSVDVLRSQGIRYAELSYSNKSTIVAMLSEVLGYIPHDIDFSFLLSANRNSFNNPQYIKDTKKQMKSLLRNGAARGFDVMGIEKPLSKKDVDFDTDTSFAHVMDEIMPLLNEYPDTVLRLHAGENQSSYTNPVTCLKVLEQVVVRHNLIVPPPFIRLGHAVYFDYNNQTEYERLLRDLNVVVEINASSNIALSHVDRVDALPYRWYRERNIPVVLATDGAGMYRTTSRQEGIIAKSVDPRIPGFIKESEQVDGVIRR